MCISSDELSFYCVFVFVYLFVHIHNTTINNLCLISNDNEYTKIGWWCSQRANSSRIKHICVCVRARVFVFVWLLVYLLIQITSGERVTT